MFQPWSKRPFNIYADIRADIDDIVDVIFELSVPAQVFALTYRPTRLK